MEENYGYSVNIANTTVIQIFWHLLCGVKEDTNAILCIDYNSISMKGTQQDINPVPSLIVLLDILFPTIEIGQPVR